MSMGPYASSSYGLSDDDLTKFEDFPLSKMRLSDSNIVSNTGDALCVRIKLRMVR